MAAGLGAGRSGFRRLWLAFALALVFLVQAAGLGSRGGRRVLRRRGVVFTCAEQGAGLAEALGLPGQQGLPGAAGAVRPQSRWIGRTRVRPRLSPCDPPRAY